MSGLTIRFEPSQVADLMSENLFDLRFEGGADQHFAVAMTSPFQGGGGGSSS